VNHRHGRFAAALGGVVLVLALTASVSAESQNKIHHKGSRAAADQESLSTVVAVSRKPVAYAPSCGGPRNAEEASYCDQRRSTVAAEKAADWAERQFWISLVGTIGLVATIIFTAVATRAANRAARASEESLNDARAEATEQSRRFEAQLRVAIDAARAATLGAEAAQVSSATERDVERAYVFGGVEKMTINPGKTVSRIHIHMVNMGRTPARIRQINFGRRDLGPMPEIPDHEVVKSHLTDSVLKAGETGKITIYETRKINGIIFGTIYFFDVFRNQHESRFCVEYDSVKNTCITAGNEAWNRYT